jgi:hypothetical protein
MVRELLEGGAGEILASIRGAERADELLGT